MECLPLDVGVNAYIWAMNELFLNTKGQLIEAGLTPAQVDAMSERAEMQEDRDEALTLTAEAQVLQWGAKKHKLPT